MNKKIILVCASTMLLASCGGGNENYLAEPSGGKVTTAKALSAPVGKLSEAMAAKSAIGLDIQASAKFDGSVTMAKMEELGGLSGKTYSAAVELSELKGHVGVGSFTTGLKGDASISGKIKANLLLPQVDVNPETYSIAVTDKNIKIDAGMSAAAYLQNGSLFVDPTGLEEGVKKVVDALKEFLPISLDETTFRKFKVALPEEFNEVAPAIPACIGGFLGQAASLFTQWDDMKAQLPEEIRPLLDGIEFKAYDGGVYGLHAAVSMKDILDIIPSEGGESVAMVKTILEKIDMKAEALLLFTESEIRSFAMTVKADVKDLSFAQFVGEDDYMPVDKVSLSLDSGFKAEFSYNDAVKIASPEDPASFKAID